MLFLFCFFFFSFSSCSKKKSNTFVAGLANATSGARAGKVVEQVIARAAVGARVGVAVVDVLLAARAGVACGALARVRAERVRACAAIGAGAGLEALVDVVRAGVAGEAGRALAGERHVAVDAHAAVAARTWGAIVHAGAAVRARPPLGALARRAADGASTAIGTRVVKLAGLPGQRGQVFKAVCELFAARAAAAVNAQAEWLAAAGGYTCATVLAWACCPTCGWETKKNEGAARWRQEHCLR